MPDCSNGMSQQAAEINLMNLKALADRYIAMMGQGAEDNQKNSRAWDAFNLDVAQDAHTVRHLAQLGLLQAGQTGATENQQTVSPVARGTGDAIVGGVGVSAEQVAANVATLSTALGDVLAKAAEALLAVVVTAAGGASTPSQTKPPTTT